MCTPRSSVVGAPENGSIGATSAYVPLRKPTPRNTIFESVGVTFTATNGNAGSPGLVTTPLGPLNHVAVTWAPPVEFLSGIDCEASDGESTRSKDLSASESAGPDANGAGAITCAVPDVAPRPDAM